METVKLSRDERATLCAHVEKSGGWPAGFGIHGSRIATLGTDDGSIVVTSDDLGDLWPELQRLIAEAAPPEEPEAVELAAVVSEPKADE